jgi:hypothetical protein
MHFRFVIYPCGKSSIAFVRKTRGNVGLRPSESLAATGESAYLSQHGTAFLPGFAMTVEGNRPGSRPPVKKAADFRGFVCVSDPRQHSQHGRCAPSAAVRGRDPASIELSRHGVGRHGAEAHDDRSTLSAKASASALIEAMPFDCASARRGLPRGAVSANTRTTSNRSSGSSSRICPRRNSRACPHLSEASALTNAGRRGSCERFFRSEPLRRSSVSGFFFSPLLGCERFRSAHRACRLASHSLPPPSTRPARVRSSSDRWRVIAGRATRARASSW